MIVDPRNVNDLCAETSGPPQPFRLGHLDQLAAVLQVVPGRPRGVTHHVGQMGSAPTSMSCSRLRRRANFGSRYLNRIPGTWYLIPWYLLLSTWYLVNSPISPIPSPQSRDTVKSPKPKPPAGKRTEAKAPCKQLATSDDSDYPTTLKPCKWSKLRQETNSGARK